MPSIYLGLAPALVGPHSRHFWGYFANVGVVVGLIISFRSYYYYPLQQFYFKYLIMTQRYVYTYIIESQ